MKKKGVELSMNVIIIAAIGLLVLLIVAFLVVNYVGKTNDGLKSCAVAYGGMCSQNCETPGSEISNTDCTKRTDGKTKCCRVIN